MKHKILAGILAAAAVAMIAVGIFSGDFADATQKAVRICMECIGIG